MSERKIIVVGGGAAGFFAAIACAEAAPGARVSVLEKSAHLLAKVRISGGGRCNVAPACYDPRELSRFYPRGGQALLGPFQAFQPQDTVDWFERRGVKLKTEKDGRIFPVTNASATIVDCLLRSAKAAGIEVLTNHEPRRMKQIGGGNFELELVTGQRLQCDRVLLATGGCRVPAAGELPVSMGHTLESPVPSLFSFHIAAPWLRELAGISVPNAEVTLPTLPQRQSGPLLITHSGLSGPAILKLSAWSARELHSLGYQAPLRINWLPNLTENALARQLDASRAAHPARSLMNSTLPPLPGRLWQNLVSAAGIGQETRWAELSRASRHRLMLQLLSTEVQVTGKTLNQDEFVTCGGVRLGEVDFKRMESRICPGLFFSGELLDIDGLTGGYNFQSAWTTGWLAGRAMADAPPSPA
jgi:predicted Rossmann fold flavoprotein